MKKLLICIVISVFFAVYAERSHAVLGIPDHVPAATVIVPYFEVGIDSTTYPHDTLPVVTNIDAGATVPVHFEMWNVFGVRAGYGNNITLSPLESRSFSVRALINSLPPEFREMFEDGAYYRGFMTFDVVTASTAVPPTDASYPFGNRNALEGWIYYTNLTQGSSNGLPMLAIEGVPPGTHNLLYGFYQNSDNREEIDADARYSAKLMTTGGSSAADPDNSIDRIDSRLYLAYENAATSKVIVFTFPSAGFSLGSNFPGNVTYKRYDEAGNTLADITYDLNRVVNVISYTSHPGPDSKNGWLSLWNVPDEFETYAFSINSAHPPGQPDLTWDAIFESKIY